MKTCETSVRRLGAPPGARYDGPVMLRKFLIALREWAVRHVLRTKDDRYGDYMLFDDMVVDVPKERDRR